MLGNGYGAGMDLGLTGKRAAVAASSAGLGLASARALVRAGARVAICGRDARRLDAASASLRDVAPDADIVAFTADVGSAAGAAAFVERARDALGGLDVLVPNAGGPPAGTFSSTPIEAYGPAIELNLLSTVAMCQAAVPAMKDQGWGRIVAITSISVRQPASHLILSNTARAGVTGFLKTLATEVAPHGVTVNSVQPGLHATDLPSSPPVCPCERWDGRRTSGPWWPSCAPIRPGSSPEPPSRSTGGPTRDCNSASGRRAVRPLGP